jgi:hypothetical protein
MTDRTRREPTMKRIATLGAVVAAFAVAPASALAGNGNFTAQVKPQLRAQVIGAQVASIQRVQATVSVQRHRVQLAQAKRWAVLRAQLR